MLEGVSESSTAVIKFDSFIFELSFCQILRDSRT